MTLRGSQRAEFQVSVSCRIKFKTSTPRLYLGNYVQQKIALYKKNEYARAR